MHHFFRRIIAVLLVFCLAENLLIPADAAWFGQPTRQIHTSTLSPINVFQAQALMSAMTNFPNENLPHRTAKSFKQIIESLKQRATVTHRLPPWIKKHRRLSVIFLLVLFVAPFFLWKNFGPPAALTEKSHPAESDASRLPPNLRAWIHQQNASIFNAPPQVSAFYADHIENSKREILKGAEGLHGTALLLGLGNGFEYTSEGLSELADQFDKIIAVDLDLEAVRGTLARLDDYRRSVGKMPATVKFDVRGDDLSHVLVTFATAVDEIIRNNDSVSMAIIESSALLRETTTKIKPANPLPYKANYVVSSLVMSQLGALMQQHMDFAMTAKYGSSYSSLSSVFEPLWADIGLATELRHINDLQQWTSPGGRVYLADTVAEIHIMEDISGNIVRTSPDLPMTLPETVSETNRLFDHASSEIHRWEWRYRPPLAPGQTGSTFTVEQLLLTPKKTPVAPANNIAYLIARARGETNGRRLALIAILGLAIWELPSLFFLGFSASLLHLGPTIVLGHGLQLYTGTAGIIFAGLLGLTGIHSFLDNKDPRGPPQQPLFHIALRLLSLLPYLIFSIHGLPLVWNLAPIIIHAIYDAIQIQRDLRQTSTDRPSSLRIKIIAALSAIVLAVIAGIISNVYVPKPISSPTPGAIKVDANSPAAQKQDAVKTLLKIGFLPLGNDYYIKSNIWIVHLQSNGGVAELFTPLIRPELDQLVSLDYHPDKSLPLQLIYKNRSTVDTGALNGSSPGPQHNGAFFSSEEIAAGTPLKSHLEKIGARAMGSGLYILGEGNETTAIIYENEKIIYIGIEHPGLGFEAGDKVIGESEGTDDFGEKKRYLELEDANVTFKIGTDAMREFGSVKLRQDFNIPLTEEQTFKTLNPDKSGFTIGATNTDESIDKLSSLTGIPIADIETRARPEAASQAGFLGIHERLKERLKKDNDYVLHSGHTHQQLAEPMFYAMNLAAKTQAREMDYTYKGEQYHLSMTATVDSQFSIFSDGLQGNKDYVITNLKTGKKLGFAELLPFYIARYGFYEGETSYRVEPRDIIDVFELRPLTGTNGSLSPDKDHPTQPTVTLTILDGRLSKKKFSSRGNLKINSNIKESA